jgi:arabinosyltransferase A
MDYTGHIEVANTRRNRVLASTPLLVVATIMVVLEVGSMAKGAAQRYPVYTTATANVDAVASGLSNTSCAMADDVLVGANVDLWGRVLRRQGMPLALLSTYPKDVREN